MPRLDKEAFFRQRNWLFFVGVKALIINKGKVLLLKAGPSELSSTKRRKAFYDIPGGKVEWGEDIKDVLKREVEEELGVPKRSLKIVRIFEASVSRFKTSHGVKVPLILITFLCELSGKEELRLTDEHVSYEWMGLEGAKTLLRTKFNDTFIDELDKL